MSDHLAETALLVRSPVHEVFDAFVQPDVLERFWLRHASGPLVAGTTVEWEFMAAGARETVTVTELTRPTSIAFSWSDGIDVELRFVVFDDTSTRVAVTARGFEAVAQAVAATAGFTIVLCDLKTLLESGRSANLVRDKAVLITADANATAADS